VFALIDNDKFRLFVFFVDFLITTVLAYGLYLLFEAPAANIIRICEQNDILGGDDKHQKEPVSADNNARFKIIELELNNSGKDNQGFITSL